MGKVKNSKKYRKKLQERSQPLPLPDTATPLSPGPPPLLPSLLTFLPETMTIATDLGSLDCQKRERACVILGNILANYSSNLQSFSHLCTADLLGKLCMRLVDSSPTVRLHAAGAVRNMTSSKFPVIAQRMIDAGIIATMITLVTETITTPPSSSGDSYAEQLVTAISNLWSLSSLCPSRLISSPQCCL